MSKTVVIYIPHVFPCGNWREFGGAPGMKRYIRKAFSSQDDSSLAIGKVKHIDIVLNKKSGLMLEDYCAFIRFIPSESEYSLKLLSNVSKDNKFRYYHNQARGFYWDFYLSEREAVKQVQDIGVQTIQEPTTNISIPSDIDSVDLLCSKMDGLYCNKPAKKRQRV